MEFCNTTLDETPNVCFFIMPIIKLPEAANTKSHAMFQSLALLLQKLIFNDL
jgi:hypothetical protein